MGFGSSVLPTMFWPRPPAVCLPLFLSLQFLRVHVASEDPPAASFLFSSLFPELFLKVIKCSKCRTASLAPFLPRWSFPEKEALHAFLFVHPGQSFRGPQKEKFSFAPLADVYVIWPLLSLCLPLHCPFEFPAPSPPLTGARFSFSSFQGLVTSLV